MKKCSYRSQLTVAKLTALFLCLGILFPGSGYATGNTDLNAANCRLKKMPNQAEMTSIHGIEFYTYPVQIKSKYTGCRTIWLGNGHQLSKEYFQGGELKWVVKNEPKGARSYCEYQKGSLVRSKSRGDCDETP